MDQEDPLFFLFEWPGFDAMPSNLPGMGLSRSDRCEAMCRAVCKAAARELPPGALTRVEVHEDADGCVEIDVYTTARGLLERLRRRLGRLLQ